MFRSLSIISLCAVLAAGCTKKEGTIPDTTPTAPAVTEEQTMQSEEVVFSAAGMTIHGTVTKPPGDGPFPAIAVAAGSGPTDRNWESPMLPGGNGSGRLLAQELARAGVVVLRYDKRGTGASGMPAAPISRTDYVSELAEATKLLAGLPYVDAGDIHAAGHSEGATHALELAANPPVPLASVILLSPAGRSLRDIVIWQIAQQLEKSGLNPAARKAEIAALTSALDKIAAGEAVDATRVGQLPGIQQFVASLQNPASVEFARALLVFEPTTAFGSIDVPVLILSGARDIQVDPELDTQPLAAAAQAAGRETKLVIVPTADHVLKHEDTPREQLDATAGLRYNAEGRTLAEPVVQMIADWAK